MKESLNISQSQQMAQRLSPRQVQYARLLEMTAPEVEEEVRRQLDDNPALEEAPDDGADRGEEYDEEYGEEYGGGDAGQAPAYDAGEDDDDPADAPGRSPATPGDGGWQIAADGPDLDALLSAQIRQAAIPEDIRAIALYIIGNIDENGYLTRTLAAMADDIAIATGVDVDIDKMRQAFAAVRDLDPAGVGAVDLRDCLMLQLQRRGPSTLQLRIAREIVGNYFDLFSKMHYDRLAAQLGLDSDDESLRQAIDIIRSLNPKPGSAVAPSASLMRWAQITPDVAVERLPGGRWSVSLASKLPRLQIERAFAAQPDGGKGMSRSEKEAQAFIKLKRDDAEAFISALRLRGNTLLDVVQAIVRRQADFFASGDASKLKPMVLKDISADTGLDLSVISRATAGKYVSTDLGVYPLKMFFNEAPSDESGASSHELMHAMRQIIEAEDKKRPLSDQAILEAMLAKGYKLARRTVAKYREKMGIPVGRLRKGM